MKECDYIKRNAYNDYYCNSINKKISYEHYIEYCTEYKHDECSNYTKCYIATFICNKIGTKESKEVLEILKYLRNAVLEKDDNYKELLNKYDSIGPIIVEKLEDNNELYNDLYTLFIKKVCDLVIIKEYDKAIKLYEEMVNYLIKTFKINDNVEKEKVLIKR